MNEHVKLDGLVPARLAPKSRKIVLDDYCVAADIGFHDFEVGAPQRLLVTVEVWVDEASFPADDRPGGAWDYDFLRTEIGALRFVIATPTLTGQTLVLDGGQRFLGLPRDVQFLEPGDE